MDCLLMRLWKSCSCSSNKVGLLDLQYDGKRMRGLLNWGRRAQTRYDEQYEARDGVLSFPQNSLQVLESQQPT